MTFSRILVVCLKYSYGILSRGEGLNRGAIVDPLVSLGYNVDTFWIDDPTRVGCIDNALILKCIDFSPDLIFFKLFRDEIKLSTLFELKKKYLTVNWFGDDQWRFENFTSKYANCFSACITTDKYSIDKYYSIGQYNVIRSQHASFSASTLLDNTIYQYDVSFVGSCNPYRKWVVAYLESNDIPSPALVMVGPTV